MTDESATVQKKVVWEDISHGAKAIFNIWTNQPELKWAKAVWNSLERRGLTCYIDEIGRHLVLIRLMTLGVLYCEFVERTWDDSFEPEIEDWAYELELNKFRIAQLVGRELSKDKDYDQDELFRYALVELIDQSRETLYIHLLDMFDGIPYLFIAMLKSNEVDEFYDRDEDEIVEKESNYDILSYMEGWCDLKARGLGWVNDGMPSIFTLA